jgi:3-oxoacyl-[acyl-carrier-protein] synthase-3
MNQHFSIAGSARALPSKVIRAEELDARLGLEAGWTARHTGVCERHQFSGPDEEEAIVRQVCLEALAESGGTIGSISFIIDASLCARQPIPCNAALVQKSLGAEAAGIPSFDVNASCLGFLAALNVVNGLFASRAAKRVLLVCSEAPFAGVNWDEPESACIMGDGAVAFVLDAAEARGAFGFEFETFSDGARLCEILGGGSRLPATAFNEVRRAAYQFHMDGKAVHKFASRHFPPLMERLLVATHHKVDDLDVVPHQASGPALEFMRRRLKLPSEKFHNSIAQHGNLLAAGIPFVLDRVRRSLPAGSKVMALGTGAGYSQAAAIFEL